MASKTFSGAVTAQSIDANNPVLLKSLLVTAAAATATATVLSNGVPVLTISAAANTSFQWSATSGGNQFSLKTIPAPVTITTTGAGAFTLVEY